MEDIVRSVKVEGDERLIYCGGIVKWDAVEDVYLVTLDLLFSSVNSVGVGEIQKCAILSLRPIEALELGNRLVAAANQAPFLESDFIEAEESGDEDSSAP